MRNSRKSGFTLIELLTVIAIIAILAAFTMTVGPRLIERAKIRRMDSALRQVSIALTAYFADNQSYPPAYGYVSIANKDMQTPPSDPTLEEKFYHLRPYMLLMKYHGNEEMYDEFSESYDTDRDGALSPLEFLPRGRKLPTNTWEFDAGLPRYVGVNDPVMSAEIQRQLDAEKRPFVYIPVNRAQFARAQKYWLNHNAFLAERWSSSDADFPNITFPPPKYDTFVLIGMGPGGNSFGLLPQALGVPEESANNGRNLYHLLALRAYFLATRDMNANGLLDFDYTARTQSGEGALEYDYKGAPVNNDLPCATPRSYGPWIYVGK